MSKRKTVTVTPRLSINQSEKHTMNRRPMVIATVIGALGGAMTVIIFLHFFNVLKVARLLSGHRQPQPANADDWVGT